MILTSENGTDYTEVSSKTGIAVPSLGRAIQYKLNTPLETAYFAVAVRGGKTSDQQYLIDMLSEIEVIGKQGSIVIVEDGDEVIDDTGLQLIDPSKFDVSVVFRSDNSNQASGKEGNLFDGNIQTEWYPKTPVSPGYEYLKPMIKITFKNNAFYRIDKIRLFGKADPKNQQFPKSIAIASSKDGITYSNKLFKSGINMITRDSISFAAENLKTSYLAIEVSEGYMVNTNISLPILNEIKIFGEEIEYIDDNNLNRPDQEENLDSIFKNEANQNLIMKSEDFLEILP